MISNLQYTSHGCSYGGRYVLCFYQVSLYICTYRIWMGQRIFQLSCELSLHSLSNNLLWWSRPRGVRPRSTLLHPKTHLLHIYHVTCYIMSPRQSFILLVTGPPACCALDNLGCAESTQANSAIVHTLLSECIKKCCHQIFE